MQIGMLLRGRGHELYVTHRLELLRRWTAQHPGSRPWAWWSLEATEPRRVVEDPDGLAAVSAAGAFEGVWRRQWGVRFHGNVNAGAPLVVESTATYLRRLELLTPTEAARLTPKDFDPVAVDVRGRNHPREEISR